MSDEQSQPASGPAQKDIAGIANEDLDALAQTIEKEYKADQTVKVRLSYNWDRNHRFLDGDQWLVFDGSQDTGGQWKRLVPSKANEYIPRPVTNYIFDAYQTLKSYLIKDKPKSTVDPNTQSFKDKSGAKVAQLCLEANWERLCEQANYEYAAACLLTYGTVFKKSYWDTSSANMVKIPRMQQQPKIDPMTGDTIGVEEIQALDEMGVPLYDMLPLGDVNTCIVEPFRIAIDPLATGPHNARWITEYSIQPLSWIVETYDKAGDGYTGLASEVKEETNLSSSMQRFYNLKSSSGVRTSAGLEGKAGSGGQDEKDLANCAVVKERYEAPSSKHPNGRLVVVANGKTLYAGESPYSGPEQGDWHPYSECRWEIVPGRFWGKSPLDNACEVQKQVNSIDAVIVLARKTMAIPQKIAYNGSGIEPGTWTGRPGQQLNVRDPSLKPEIIPAQGVDRSVFEERAQRVDDLKNITGAIDILKGDRPAGVNAAAAFSTLFEIGSGKLFPVLERWRKLVETDQKKQLKLIAKKYIEPRPQYIALLKKKNTELSEEAINKFIGEDLMDNCNVVIEAGSNIPKLKSAQQARLEQAALAGTLNLESPINRREYNRQMGIQGFDNDVGPDIKRAEWENDLLDNVEMSPDNKPIVLAVDDHAVHLEVLAKRMKEPSFMECSEAVMNAYMMHYQEHLDAQAQAQQTAVMEAMANGTPPEQMANGMDPTQASGHGRGAPSAVREGIAKADAPPASIQ